MTGALPLLYNRSSSNRLYSSIRLINCLISSGGLLINESYNSESSGNPIRKVLVAIFFVTSANLVVQLLVSVNIVVEGFPSPYFH